MRVSRKPVRKCYACLLNLGDRCWLYDYPRGQWRHGRSCRAFGNEELYETYRRWSRRPAARTRKELRQAFFRSQRQVTWGSSGGKKKKAH